MSLIYATEQKLLATNGSTHGMILAIFPYSSVFTIVTFHHMPWMWSTKTLERPQNVQHVATRHVPIVTTWLLGKALVVPFLKGSYTTHYVHVNLNPCCAKCNFAYFGIIRNFASWTSCQIRKNVGCTCAGNAGNVFPAPRVSDPDMHHGTCVTHVSWFMSGSLSSGFLWTWWGKRSRHSRRMRNPQFYASGKRPMAHAVGSFFIL